VYQLCICILMSIAPYILLQTHTSFINLQLHASYSIWIVSTMLLYICLHVRTKYLVFLRTITCFLYFLFCVAHDVSNHLCGFSLFIAATFWLRKLPLNYKNYAHRNVVSNHLTCCCNSSFSDSLFPARSKLKWCPFQRCSVREEGTWKLSFIVEKHIFISSEALYGSKKPVDQFISNEIPVLFETCL
jgi:hypothetical protein